MDGMARRLQNGNASFPFRKPHSKEWTYRGRKFTFCKRPSYCAKIEAALLLICSIKFDHISSPMSGFFSWLTVPNVPGFERSVATVYQA